MALPYFGTYTLSATGYAAAGGAIKTDVKAMLDVLLGLIPEEGVAGTPDSPDFNRLDAHTSGLIRGEIARMKTQIDAAS